MPGGGPPKTSPPGHPRGWIASPSLPPRGPSGRWARQGRLGTEGPPWVRWGPDLPCRTPKRRKGLMQPMQQAVRDALIAFMAATSQALG
jgi:hypothetical protein